MSRSSFRAKLEKIELPHLTIFATQPDYVARRTAQGLSKREIIRCLKRYVAREIYHLIRKTCPTPKVSGVSPA
ncbi:hypothetical protein H6F89_11030 [Cyanobacteria bacterium FACHB-63]|nr:hypothetical protein [Cyanobacteria bacterium FACHB-63]